MKANYYLDKWSLVEPTFISQTRTSIIYKVMKAAEPLILKILTETGVRDESAGAWALKAFGGNGAIWLINHDETAHLLEYVEGPNLRIWVEQGKDEQATEIAADVIIAMMNAANARSSSAGLIPLKRWFRSLLTADASNFKFPLLTEAALVADELLENPTDSRVLHGDFHHENCLLSTKRGWLSIDPKGLWGESTFDAVNLLFNPYIPELIASKKRIERQGKILAEKTGFDFKRIMKFGFAYGHLSALWSLEDGDNPDMAIRIATLCRDLI